MFLQDFLVKQIQQFMQQIVRRILQLTDLALFEGQDLLAAEMAQILEQLSGLAFPQLLEMEAGTLSWLLNLRCEGEDKLLMAAVLRLQADLAARGSGFGSSSVWLKVAADLDRQAGAATISRSTAELLRQLEEQRQQLS